MEDYKKVNPQIINKGWSLSPRNGLTMLLSSSDIDQFKNELQQRQQRLLTQLPLCYTLEWERYILVNFIDVDGTLVPQIWWDGKPLSVSQRLYNPKNSITWIEALLDSTVLNPIFQILNSGRSPLEIVNLLSSNREWKSRKGIIIWGNGEYIFFPYDAAIINALRNELWESFEKKVRIDKENMRIIYQTTDDIANNGESTRNKILTAIKSALHDSERGEEEIYTTLELFKHPQLREFLEYHYKSQSFDNVKWEELLSNNPDIEALYQKAQSISNYDTPESFVNSLFRSNTAVVAWPPDFIGKLKWIIEWDSYLSIHSDWSKSIDVSTHDIGKWIAVRFIKSILERVYDLSGKKVKVYSFWFGDSNNDLSCAENTDVFFLLRNARGDDLRAIFPQNTQYVGEDNVYAEKAFAKALIAQQHQIERSFFTNHYIYEKSREYAQQGDVVWLIEYCTQLPQNIRFDMGNILYRYFITALCRYQKKNSIAGFSLKAHQTEVLRQVFEEEEVISMDSMFSLITKLTKKWHELSKILINEFQETEEWNSMIDKISNKFQEGKRFMYVTWWSGAWKSTTMEQIALQISDKGIKVITLDLDEFLIPKGEMQEKWVSAYDIEARNNETIRDIISEIKNSREEEAIVRIPLYNRQTMQSDGFRTIGIPRDSMVILDCWVPINNYTSIIGIEDEDIAAKIGIFLPGWWREQTRRRFVREFWRWSLNKNNFTEYVKDYFERSFLGYVSQVINWLNTVDYLIVNSRIHQKKDI